MSVPSILKAQIINYYHEILTVFANEETTYHSNIGKENTSVDVKEGLAEIKLPKFNKFYSPELDLEFRKYMRILKCAILTSCYSSSDSNIILSTSLCSHYRLFPARFRKAILIYVA